MQFMLAPFPQGGNPLQDGDPSRAADVLNNSWGCPANFEGCAPDVFAPAVDALSQAGIFVVGSAGNEGPSCSSVTAPLAIYASVLTVGAVDAAGNLAFFSSVGPVTVDESGRTKPDVLAPGVDILSAWPGSAYVKISGTSMAGPHLAGTVALMWSANPALRGDIERTRAIIQETASPFQGGLEGSVASGEDPISDTLVDSTAPLADMVESSAGCLVQTDLNQLPNNVAGYGVVDVYAAVQAALAFE
jgi:subtilisin family serine protease